VNELNESMRRLADLMGDLSIDLRTAVQALSRERWWRRVSFTVVAVMFVFALVGWTWSRQADCDRGNRSRVAIRASVSAAVGSVWDQVAANDPGKDELLAAVDEDVAAALPPRDCSWPA
jgi:hypothetical protein